MRGRDFWQVEVWEQVMEIERTRGMMLPDTFQLEIVRKSHQTWICRAVLTRDNVDSGLCDIPPSTERTVEAAIARFLLSADRKMRMAGYERFPAAGPWPEGGSFNQRDPDAADPGPMGPRKKLPVTESNPD